MRIVRMTDLIPLSIAAVSMLAACELETGPLPEGSTPGPPPATPPAACDRIRTMGDPLQFGLVALGGAARLPITFINDGEAALISLLGTRGSSAYSTDEPVSSGLLIEAHQARNLMVTYEPSGGVDEVTFDFSFDDGACFMSISADGRGLEDAVRCKDTVPPPPTRFLLHVGECYEAHVECRNESDHPLRSVGVTVHGDPAFRLDPHYRGSNYDPHGGVGYETFSFCPDEPAEYQSTVEVEIDTGLRPQFARATVYRTAYIPGYCTTSTLPIALDTVIDHPVTTRIAFDPGSDAQVSTWLVPASDELSAELQINGIKLGRSSTVSASDDALVVLAFMPHAAGRFTAVLNVLMEQHPYGGAHCQLPVVGTAGE